MKHRNIYLACGVAALGLTLAALPGSSTAPQTKESDAISKLQHRIEELEARLGAEPEVMQEPGAVEDSLQRIYVDDLNDQETKVEAVPAQEIASELALELPEEGASWLGVETREVTASIAKDLKLPGERGVVVSKIIPESPASKAGLKENDAVTEINGQHIEGTAQFRRMIHETPAGRTVQLTLWRDGHSQTVSVTLGKSEDRHHAWMHGAPGTFAFHMPDMPELKNLPEINWDGGMLTLSRPRLGIDAEDLSGQLGTYFGAPEGEGVLVREVNSGSAAEKAGMKAGDVITAVDGARVRTRGELREKLAAREDDKPAKIAVIRNKSEVTLSVELPAAAKQKVRRLSGHRTNI